MTTEALSYVARLLVFHPAGHRMHLSSPLEVERNCVISGYESPESLCNADSPSRGAAASFFGSCTIPADGIPVIDLRAAIERHDGRNWLFSGPMVDVDMPAGERDGRDPSAGRPVSVGIADYVHGWRMHGARIGRAYRRADGSTSIEWNSAQPAARSSPAYYSEEACRELAGFYRWSALRGHSLGGACPLNGGRWRGISACGAEKHAAQAAHIALARYWLGEARRLCALNPRRVP